MKNHLLLLLFLVSAVSCTQREMEAPESHDVESHDKVLTFSIENTGDTKVHLGQDNHVLWSMEDQIVVYNGTTEGVVYVLDDDSAGKTTGRFNFENFQDNYHEISMISHKVAYYPFDYDVYCVPDRANDQSYKLRGVSLPSVQTHMHGSVDPKAFPMAVAADRNEGDLAFRNVCGVLKLQLYGDCIVSEITLTGNNGEKLSGSAEVVLDGDYQTPRIVMSNDASTSVALYCGEEEVLLNMHSPTVFMISIPPTEFAEGFKITVTDRHCNDYVLETDASQSVRRSTILRMPHISIYGDVIEPESPELSGMLSVLEKRYDGYDMRITVPESVKASGNSIRWNQCCLMTYLYISRYNDFYHLLYNASNWTHEDITLEYSDDNIFYESDSDSDGDGEPDLAYKYNPITPGEPVVFISGEFAYVDETYDGGNNDIMLALMSWGGGYYLPLLDEDWLNHKDNYVELDGMTITRSMDNAWHGAFERQFFRVKEPSVLDGGVDVVLEDVSPTSLKLNFIPAADVYQYTVLILDDPTYDWFMSLIDYREEFKQWAVASYFSFYNFGAISLSGNVVVDASSNFIDGCMPDSNYHVLVTAMGDREGTSQSFQECTFRTTSKVLPAPVIEVTPVGSTAYDVSFNIKCTSAQDGNPVEEAYYASNYVREWVYATNGGASYYDLVNGNYMFSYEELSYINSEEGFIITIPSLDGETTRIAVLGYNSENTPNDLNYHPSDILNCPAVADQTAEWLEKKDPVGADLLEKLYGDWTATVVLENNEGRYNTTSTIKISADVCDYPSTLPTEVYSLYESFGYSRREVDEMWDEFTTFADIITEKRLVNQNRLLCTGWIEGNKNEYLDTRSPYDLFIADDYSGYDVETMFYDFGPKWYIEAVLDTNTGYVSLVMPFSFSKLPPASNWCGDYHIAAIEHENYICITEGNLVSVGFPVEYNEENDIIRIKPMLYEGRQFYPTMIAFDNFGNLKIEDVIVSEIVLTRAASDSTKATRSVRKPSGDVPAKVNSHYKPRTRLSAPAQTPVVEVEIPTFEQAKVNADRYVRQRFGLE